MTEIQILAIAKEHIENLNMNNSYSDKMSWIVTKPIITSKGYYFNYKFELMNPDEPLAFGGSPGFIISQETGELKNINWQEFNDLKIK